MMKLEIAKPVGKLRMLVPGSCCDEAEDREAGDVEAGGEARDACARLLL